MPSYDKENNVVTTLFFSFFFFQQTVTENEGVIPSKYANAELMKIPNFLHLTPAHVQKQCAALKGESVFKLAWRIIFIALQHHTAS